jgi:hypothetical protein
MIVLFNSFKPVVPSQPQYSGFNNGYLGYGDTIGNYTALVTYNRTISFSTDTESTRTAFAAARAPQGSSGFSPTSIYHVKGYNAGLVTTVDRVSPITDTSSTPTIAFTTERRGPCIPLPNYNRNRIFFFGGYSETLAQYRADTTYITQNTETAANGTSIPAARHLGSVLYTRDNSYLLGGIDSTGATTTTIYKYIMNTDTTSTLAATDTSNGQGYGLSYNSFGYRANGTPASYNNNKKFTFSTETVAAGTSGPTVEVLSQGISTVSLSIGYCWTGYRSVTTNRLYQKLTFATETWSGDGYNSGDTNQGWLNAPGGC